VPGRDACGASIRWGLWKSGYERGLGQREVGGLLVEVRLGGRLHPIGVRAEVHRVQVEIEDLLLGVLALQLPGQGHLVELAVEREVGPVEIEISNELHGDGGETLGGLLGLHVRHQRPHEALEINALVTVEALVLDGDDGVAQYLWDLLAADDRAVLDAME